MTRGELTAFDISAFAESDGPITDVHQQSPLLRAAALAIEQRIERIRRQQYSRIAAVRRDVTYEMCGTRATVVLSGNGLLGAPTPGSTAPIRNRLYAWIVVGGVLIVATFVLRGELAGRSAYFASLNAWLTLLAMAATLLSVFAIGGFLRAFRRSGGPGPIRLSEKLGGLGAMACWLLMLAAAALSRPSMSEVEGALESGNVGRARRTVNALKEVRGETSSVLNAEDAVILAEVEQVDGDDRLAQLDRVAERGGELAPEAAKRARGMRLEQIRAHVRAKSADAAIAAIDRGFPNIWQKDPEIAEERALAHEIEAAACKSEPCIVRATGLANGAASTAHRKERAQQSRERLVAALLPADSNDEAPLTRLRRLRTVLETATLTLESLASDKELAAKAKSAKAWASAERAKSPLLGASPEVLGELLQAKATAKGNVHSLAVDGSEVHATVDPSGCKGLYIVGAKKGDRGIKGAAWSGERFLSQAFGRSVAVRKPASGRDAKWNEGSVAVVARWDGGELVELRVGDAKP